MLRRYRAQSSGSSVNLAHPSRHGGDDFAERFVRSELHRDGQHAGAQGEFGSGGFALHAGEVLVLAVFCTAQMPARMGSDDSVKGGLKGGFLASRGRPASEGGEGERCNRK